MATPVQFSVSVDFEAPSRSVWDELVDWKGHEAWIPMTRVEVDGDDPTAVGATFTAWTGVGRMALEDRMKVTECSWDEATRTGVCRVEKLGPILRGGAGFEVEPVGDGSRVEWIEDVTVPWLPGFMAPAAAWVGSMGFKQGMNRLNKLLVKNNA